jgi:hypothetical protein
VALVAFLAYTCEGAAPEEACPMPKEGSRQANLIAEGKGQAGFAILYPCKLPNSQILTAFDVLGPAGKQTVSIAFDGPFQITIRQSQIAPVINADPTGASHSVVRNLFPGTDAELIEINEGSGNAQYRLIWSRARIYYEVVMTGPPLQRKAVLDLARSLTELS